MHTLMFLDFLGRFPFQMFCPVSPEGQAKYEFLFLFFHEENTVTLSVEFGVYTFGTSDTHSLFESTASALPRELQGQGKHTHDIELGK